MGAINWYSFGAGGAISNVDATSYATASVTPTDGRVGILIVAAKRTAGEPNNPTATGNGVTYTRLTSVYTGDTKLSLFTAPYAGSSAGAVTVDYGGQTQNTHAYIFGEMTINTTTPLVQNTTGSVLAGTTYTMTLGGAFASEWNGTLVAIACDANTGSLRPELGYNVGVSSSANAMAVPFRDAEGLTLGFGWRADNDTACVITQGSANGQGIMVELGNPSPPSGGGGGRLVAGSLAG